MPPPAIVFRSPLARAYAVTSWAVAALVVGAFATHGGVSEVVGYGALPGVLAVVGWVAFWRPELRVQRDGVRVVNLLSTTWLPWSAITGTKTRWGLELATTGGPVGVWAVPARSSVGRWTTARRPVPQVPHLPTLETVVSGGGDPLVAAEVIEEHHTGVTGSEPAGAAPERRLDPVPAGLLLVFAALALVALLS